MDSQYRTPESDYVEQDSFAGLDIGKYVLVLVNWWREILLFGVIGGLLTTGVTFLYRTITPPVFEASATAVIARTVSNVSLDDRFETFSDESILNRNSNIEAARRASLVGLVDSPAIAAEVILQLGDTLAPTKRIPGVLLESVNARSVPGPDSRTPSELIRITARADSPDLAANIANAWVESYVDSVNSIYGQVPDNMLARIEEELGEVSQAFEEAQKDLEEFIATSQVGALNRKIEANLAMLTELTGGQSNASAAVITADLETRLKLFEQLVAVETEPTIALVENHAQALVGTIQTLYTIRQEAMQQLRQAEALQRQIAAGGDPATNAVALQMLKTQIYAPTTTSLDDLTLATPLPEDETSIPFIPAILLPSQTQWSISADVNSDNVATQQADIDAMIQSLQTYIAVLEDQLEVVQAAVSTNDNQQFLADLLQKEFALDQSIDTEASSPTDALTAAILESYSELFEVGTLTAQLQAMDNDLENTSLDQTIGDIEGKIQALSAELEAEYALERQLTQRRDLAWNSYDALSNRIEELKLERTASNREVRVGTPATAPLQPVSEFNPLLLGVLGGVIGLLAGCVYAYLATYLGRKPFLTRSAETT